MIPATKGARCGAGVGRVIKLRPGSGILATTTDIIDNPKKLVNPGAGYRHHRRSLEDLDAAVVNTDWALKPG